MKRPVLLFLLLPFFFSGCHSRAPLTPGDLRCEYVVNPNGMDVIHPRLSWVLPFTGNDQRQTAWQVIAATDTTLLDPKKADLWNSGKVVSDQSTQVKYNGKVLKPRMEVWWRVRVWDRHGRVSAWSAPARWEMGLMYHSWQAQWIGSPVLPPAQPGGPNPAYYFRKEINLPASPGKGRVYISGLGYYELYINGQKVGDHVLSPNHSNYTYRDTTKFTGDYKEVRHMSFRVYYETFDITPYLHAGANTLGVILGNGWYFQHESEGDTPYSYGLPRLLARFEIAGDEGEDMIIVSDTTWKTSTGPILHNGIYTGEIYDARREIPGWVQPGYDDSAWPQAIVRTAPRGRLLGQIAPPDRMIREVKPVSRKVINDTTLRYDLGEMISGWARLHVKGTAGTRITLRFIEEMGPQYGQTDTYILKGKGTETWQPRFTWHGFRYVLLTHTAPLDTLALTGVVVNTDVPQTGSFTCSNDLFTRLNENFIRTQEGNMHGGVPSDCPHRERRGYTGDGQIAAPAAICNFDMSAFYTKWIGDMADGQNRINGFVPYTVPFQSGWGGTPWGSAYIIVPWYMYLYYGDTTIIRKHWQGMKKYISYLQSRLIPPGIVDEELLGEWVPPDPTVIPRNLVSTAYFHHDLQIMRTLAGVLKKEREARRFDSLMQEVKKGFNEKYFHKEEMSYSIGRQGANVFALGYGLVPAQYIPAVFRTLTDHVLTTGHFDTGMMGTPLLLQVLTRYGRMDLAYTLMNQKDFPGYGLEILKGSTTLWEQWDGVNSHSHPMFGSVCEWFYSALAGINPDPSAPGFRHIIIRPRPVYGLTHAAATYLSPYGPVTSSWQTDSSTFTLEVTVPPNSTATVYLPAISEKAVSASGEYQQPDVGITFDSISGHEAVYHLLAGKYKLISHGITPLLQHPLLTAPTVFPLDTLLFLGDSLTVTMHSDLDNTVIRYTLDGKIPDSTSPRYTGPVTFTRRTKLMARAFGPDGTASPVTRHLYNFIDPEKNGLHYNYYQGLWQRVPDFSRITTAAQGILHDINLDEITYNKDRFALLVTGWIETPKSGNYTFYLTSNDGSRLWIDGREIINNDGGHPAREKEGHLTLTAGRHRLRIGYFQLGGGYFLGLDWKEPGGMKEPVPPDLLYHTLK